MTFNVNDNNNIVVIIYCCNCNTNGTIDLALFSTSLETVDFYGPRSLWDTFIYQSSFVKQQKVCNLKFSYPQIKNLLHGTVFLHSMYSVNNNKSRNKRQSINIYFSIFLGVRLSSSDDNHVFIL